MSRLIDILWNSKLNMRSEQPELRFCPGKERQLKFSTQNAVDCFFNGNSAVAFSRKIQSLKNSVLYFIRGEFRYYCTNAYHSDSSTNLFVILSSLSPYFSQEFDNWLAPGLFCNLWECRKHRCRSCVIPLSVPHQLGLQGIPFSLITAGARRGTQHFQQGIVAAEDVLW